jgi:hypothetical protein
MSAAKRLQPRSRKLLGRCTKTIEQSAWVNLVCRHVILWGVKAAVLWLAWTGFVARYDEYYVLSGLWVAS